MCDPITMTLVAVSAYGSIQMGKAQKAQAEYQGAIARRQAEIQNAQLEEDLKIAEIRAHDEEQIRKDKMRESVASMRALNKGRESGSFLAMVDADEEALRFDIGNIRLGLAVTGSRIGSQIAINNIGAAGVGADAKLYEQAGYFDAATTLLKGGSEYMASRTPPKKTRSTTYGQG